MSNAAQLTPDNVTRDEKTGKWSCPDLIDIFDTMLPLLRTGDPFSFPRYGDGEWNAIIGKQGQNCDGHQYFGEMGSRLEETLSSPADEPPPIYMGLQPLSVSHMHNKIAPYLEGIEWFDADSLHNASIDGRLGEFVDALTSKRRPIILVGPEHLESLTFIKPVRTFTSMDAGNDIQILVPDKNCWTHYEQVKELLSQCISPRCVVLYCCSMMAEVLIHDFATVKNITQIDCGSVFDPYCGKDSRSYHKKLTSKAL